MMFRTLCSVSLTALFAIYGLHHSHDLSPFIFPPHFFPLPLVFSSSASLRLIGFRSHTSQSSRHFIYSIHAFNEWSNHGAIKCKQPLRIVWQGGATSGLPVLTSARRSPFQNFGWWLSFFCDVHFWVCKAKSLSEDREPMSIFFFFSLRVPVLFVLQALIWLKCRLDLSWFYFHAPVANCKIRRRLA